MMTEIHEDGLRVRTARMTYRVGDTIRVTLIDKALFSILADKYPLTLSRPIFFGKVRETKRKLRLARIILFISGG